MPKTVEQDRTHLLSQALACADLCELFSIAFDYPAESFVKALQDGSYAADVSSCLDDLGAAFDEKQFAKSCSKDSQSAMSQEYSRLYIGPGKLCKILPYEGAFKATMRNSVAKTALFIAPETKDVEQWMKRYGELPEDSRQMPVDSVTRELDFLKKLYTNLANAMLQEESEEEHLGAVIAFRKDHIDIWIPEFFKQTIQETRLAAYRVLAEEGLRCLDVSDAWTRQRLALIANCM